MIWLLVSAAGRFYDEVVYCWGLEANQRWPRDCVYLTGQRVQPRGVRWTVLDEMETIKQKKHDSWSPVSSLRAKD